MVAKELIEKLFEGDPRSIARAITMIESGSEGAAELMKSVFPRTGKAMVIGITGSPGAGKSSLVDKLALYYKDKGEKIGIVCVDPSSPFSGGAILGDRIRMATLGLDKNVFIRSMATRGNLGGLSRATVDAVAILDAAGFDKIIVETVGVGQDEVEIVGFAEPNRELALRLLKQHHLPDSLWFSTLEELIQKTKPAAGIIPLVSSFNFNPLQ